MNARKKSRVEFEENDELITVKNAGAEAKAEPKEISVARLEDKSLAETK